MKNIILKTISTIMFIVFIFCACCLDSTNATPFYIGCVVSFGWLVLFMYENKENFVDKSLKRC